MHRFLGRALMALAFGCIFDAGKKVKGRNCAIIIRNCHAIYRPEQLKTQIFQGIVFSVAILACIVHLEGMLF